ncbi:DUF1778 domain-containing protein [Argonema antarcticum]|uniref:type II toxin-antitoxin system TacA family antitoxin n=1 Tax=Argonema antarcticum TaxID=2942763 RepID=UPI0020127D90|nr:DUF1778 domain-containing protein [Argonema antarcticum]MCL1476028.1 DUF1778 domain-containing protein [Argonema antarcticum A004/B2]
MAVLDRKSKVKRSEVVNMRVEPNQLDLIDTAAHLCGKSRTAFILDAAYQAAEQTLLERTLFLLNDEQWEAFNKALDAPPSQNEKLRQLLQTKAPWE